MDKKTAIVILNYIQYVNVKPAMDELKKRGIKVDVYCPVVENQNGFEDMFNKTVEFLTKDGYKVYRSVNNNTYKVLLEPYPCMDIKATYRIRYRYGTISAKPKITYIPENYLKYDTILCSGSYDSNYLSVYSDTSLVGNTKYINFKRTKHNHNKKVLLYLPTYGSDSSLDEISTELNKLRKDFYVIAKIHHGTTFLHDEKERIDKIKENVDEFYDCFKDLSDLLSYADVVLTDNSGSIFEAMYVHVPVAVFCKDINEDKLGDFNTTQYELYKEGILPYTNLGSELLSILKSALSIKISEKQIRWAKDNLHYSSKPQKEFADVVEKYLYEKFDKRNYIFHKIFANKYYEILNENYNLKNENREIQIYKDEINRLNNIIDDNNRINKRKLYKIASKIYNVVDKIRGKDGKK